MSAEVRRATSAIDEFLLVAGWGGVRPEHVGAALANLGPVRDKLIGFVLNGVDMEAARWMPSIELDLIRDTGSTVLDRRWPGQPAADPMHLITEPSALLPTLSKWLRAPGRWLWAGKAVLRGGRS